MTNYREQYKRLLTEYERLGGNLQGVPRFYSLENEAKLRREMSKLANKPMSQFANKPICQLENFTKAKRVYFIKANAQGEPEHY